LVARKSGSRTDFPWVLLAVLAIWAGSLVAERPKVVFHSDPRWIGDYMWVGIPVLFALALFVNFIAHIWRTREERELQRLRNARLRSEGQHPRQLRRQEKQEQKRKDADLQEQIAELMKQRAELRRKAKGEAAELQKQQLREEIKQEKLLRDERSRQGMEGVA
jgi:flagellar biosynthesis/type III secretory pathway M-ring protein FliF/YscJ